jgi:predicted TPR repeat methyltransferase
MASLPLAASSGDLIADRRFAIARDLAARGELAGAAEVLMQALELTPKFRAAWFALGEVRETLGDRAAAAEAFRRVLLLDPDDEQGASVRLAHLDTRTQAMPPAYVRNLFDQYAPRYEEALVERLGYCAPRLLREAVEAAQRARGLPIRFRRMLDLGCGTGLAAEAFAACCENIIGFDLSRALIEQAASKHLYAGLAIADLIDALDREHESADLIIAADALVYVADLDRVCRAAARVLEPRGLFAFTTETHDGAGVVLGRKLRYAHSAACVRDALAAAGLTVLSLDAGSARKEGAVPVPGLVAVAAQD